MTPAKKVRHKRKTTITTAERPDESLFWPNITYVPEFEELKEQYLGKFSEKQVSLIKECFYYAQSFYDTLPAEKRTRNNGEHAFVHPVNVMIYLAKAKADLQSVCAGILHDLIEEGVDKKIKDEGIKTTEQRAISRLEQEVEASFSEKVKNLCETAGYDETVAGEISETVYLLTRHKRHRYYRSIAQIFYCKDPEKKVRALLVKLADRMHNIQTIENYEDKDKKHQCFKNDFILNNADRLMGNKNFLKSVERRVLYSLEKLRKKNGKTTALVLCKMAIRAGSALLDAGLEYEGVGHCETGLKKYECELSGFERVTPPAQLGKHSSDMYHGTVRKLDALLHHDYSAYEKALEREARICRETLPYKPLSDEDIRKIIDYKDIIALKEITWYLTYPKQGKLLYIKHFGCSELCSRERECMREA